MTTRAKKFTKIKTTKTAQISLPAGILESDLYLDYSHQKRLFGDALPGQDACRHAFDSGYVTGKRDANGNRLYSVGSVRVWLEKRERVKTRSYLESKKRKRD